MKGYYVKIRLDYMRPLMWKDVVIPENITFKQLHACIQILFGLDDIEGYYHLYQFSFKNSNIFIKDLSIETFSMYDNIELDSRNTYIDDYFNKYKSINYKYDFGDEWSFTIEIKKIIDYNKLYPTIKRFKGEYNLIQDCGGCGGFSEVLYYKMHPNEADDVYSELLCYLYEFDMEDAQEELINYFDA